VQNILTIEASIKAYLFIIIIRMMTQTERKGDDLLLSSDEFSQIHSNFEFSNYKHQIRSSNLVEFEFYVEASSNSTF
jgi:hypothetical protein